MPNSLDIYARAGFKVPDFYPVAKNEYALVERNLEYTDLSGVLHTCPVYYITDYSSIPWIIEPFFNHYDTRIEGAMHDWFYSSGYPKDLADNLYKEMMFRLNYDAKYIRQASELARLGLVIGGSKSYKRCRKNGLVLEYDFATDLMSENEILSVKELISKVNTGDYMAKV